MPLCPIIPESLSVGITTEDPNKNLNIFPHTKSYTNEKDFSRYFYKLISIKKISTLLIYINSKIINFLVNIYNYIPITILSEHAYNTD